MTEKENSAESLLQDLLKNFEKCSTMSGSEYLNNHLLRLEHSKEVFRGNSIDPKLSPRARAKARDSQKLCEGLIGGIKFGLSFLVHKEELK